MNDDWANLVAEVTVHADIETRDARWQNRRLELQGALDAMMSALATLLAADEWTSASKPGVLSRPLVSKPGWQVFVPFFMTQGAPGRDNLEMIAAFALDHVRATSEGELRLSGSATYLRVVHHIADLDFCEHAQDRPWLSKCVKNSNPHVTLLVKSRASPSDKWNEDWRFGNEVTDRLLLDQTKVDAIGKTPLGVLEITNMVLGPSVRDQTFAAQEIAISAGACPVLSDLDHVAKYVRFLDAQIREYAKKNPTKALKRALSLSSFMLLKDLSERITALLRTSNVAQAAAARARREVREKIQGIDDEVIKDLRTQLSDEVQGSEEDSLREATDLSEQVAADLQRRRKAAMLGQ